MVETQQTLILKVINSATEETISLQAVRILKEYMERTKKQYINLDGASKLNHGVSGT
jgi:hypothetical protein